MMRGDAGLTSLFMQEFEWCKVQPGEAAAIVTETGSRPEYLEASVAALTAMGARPFQIMLPFRSSEMDGTPAINRGNASSTVLNGFPEVVELLKRVTLVVDLTLEGLIHSDQRGEILASGARLIVIREPADALARLLPTAERTVRIDKSVELLKNASQMTVTSKSGTNLRVDLRGSAPKGSYGFCAKPGVSANWATGMALTYPASLEVDGDVILAPGDIVYPFYTYVRSEVALRFRGGFVEAVEGASLDAELIRDYMARWNDRNAYGISHVGWGLHERALWDAITFYPRNEAMGVDGRSFEGNFLISTGPNYVAKRHTACHFDIPMRNCSVFLDGKPVVLDGAIVEPTIVRR